MTGRFASAKRPAWPWLIAPAVLVLGIVLWAVFAGPADADPTQDPAETSRPSETVAGDVGVKDPAVHSAQHLSLSSVYTSSILNPDCSGEYGESVASLELTNTSQQYLLHAQLRAVLSDGSTLDFSLHDLPAGAVAEVFDTANTPLPEGLTCERIECLAEQYLDGSPIHPDISISYTDTGTVLTNIGTDTLSDLQVVYRCDMGGQYFGGISYTVTLGALAPGANTLVTDAELFGAAYVVRVYR